MNFLLSDSSSDSLSYTISETTLFDSVEGCVTKDAQQEKNGSEIDTDDSTPSITVPSVPQHFLRITEVQQQLIEKLEEATKQIVEMCKKHLEMRQNDILSTEESLREIATAQFLDDNDNRYRLRQEDHDNRLQKLREEQLIIQESIFGSAK